MSETSPVTLLYLIKQVELAVRARLDEAVEPKGLTALQYTALTVLERHPGLTSAQLARNSFVRAQTMAQMTTHLERGGFISREADTQNRRQIRLSLTPHGREVVDDLRDVVDAIEGDLTSGMSEKEITDFRQALRAGRAALSGSTAH